MSNSNTVHVFGIKSKYLEKIINHPWISMCVILILALVVPYMIEGDAEKTIRAIKILTPIVIICTALMRLSQRNSCYRVIIDENKKTISLFRTFTQEIITESLDNVKVKIDRYINLIVNGRTLFLDNRTFYKTAAYLPSNTEIEFIGFFGRSLEKEWIKHERAFAFWPKIEN
jgi:hypothetical protein